MIRVVRFPHEPEMLLLYVPEDVALEVQTLQHPFTRAKIVDAFPIGTHVSDGVPGRWTSTMSKVKKDLKAERGQRHRQQEETEAAIMRSSSSPFIQSRAEAILRKNAVDDRARALKVAINKAKSDLAQHGRYMDSKQYRKLEADLEAAKQESQAIQTRLGELREKEKAANIEQEKRNRDLFKKAAQSYLDPEDFEYILELAAEMQEEE